MKTNHLTLGALMVSISVLFQSIPVFFSEIFIFMTIFSALPVYICARINVRLGTAVYILTGLCVTLVSPHEAMMFLLTNGILGWSLGSANFYSNKRLVIVAASALLLGIGLIALNFIFGISIFAKEISVSLLAFIFSFTILYSLIYLLFANYIFNLLYNNVLKDN